MTITGPGEQLLTIDAHHASRVIEVFSDATEAMLGALTLANGLAGDVGGAILNHGTLTLDEVTLTGK